jgi:WD40 repeat protein
LTPEECSILSSVLKDTAEAGVLKSGQIDLLIQLGVVLRLEQERPLECGPVLANAAANHPQPAVREAAYTALGRLATLDPVFADSFYRLALEYDHLAARQHILSTGLLPGRTSLKALLDWLFTPDTDRAVDLSLVTIAFFEDASPELRGRILTAAAKSARFRRWGKLLENLQSGEQAGFNAAVELFPSLTERERIICRDHLIACADLDEAAREALNLLFIYHEDQLALHRILQAGWLPEKASDRALFYFLSGQAEKLKEFDFDGSRLVSAYATASKPLRRRLLAFSRQSGQVEWLRAVSRTADVRYLSDLGDADWDAILNRLASGERYLDLWRLAHSAPPRWSAAILARLASFAWKPEAAADQELYLRLLPLAQACWHRPLDLRPLHTFTAPSENITCLSVEPKFRLLAAGTTTQTIYLWDLPLGDLHFPSLSGPAPVTRALSFSPDGEYLAAAGGDQRIRLFRHSTGQIVKTLEGHRGLVRAITVHPNGRLLVSAGFDGTLRSWRFPHGSELRRMDSDSKENFSLAILPENDIIASAGSGWNISLWKLSDGALLRRIPSGSDGILHLAAAHASELIASAGRDRALSVWNAHTGLLVRRFSLHASPITGLAFFPGDQILVTTGQDGILYLWNLSSPDPIASLVTGENSINAMTLSSDGQTLITAAANGHLAVWNFSSLLWTTRSHLPGKPLPLEDLEDRLKLSGISSGEKSWLEFTALLWRWTRRYDVEIGETPAISFDEFDIEL